MKYAPNIEAVAALQPDFMGFIFYPPSKRFVGVEFQIGDISSLPKEIKKVAVFVNAQLNEVEDFSRIYGIGHVQLHGDETPEFCAALKAQGFKIIKAFGVDDSFDFSALDKYADKVDYFLFDTKTADYGGSGKTFDWHTLKAYSLEIPFFLSGGLDADNLQKLKDIQHPQLYGVDLNSRFETEPAIKDAHLLEKVFKDIRQ